MKHLKISLFLLGIIVSIVACQQSFEDDFGLTENGESIAALNAKARSANVTPEFMPLNVIPEWAEDKMTPEEYELWKIMSTNFKIDYSFLFDERYEAKRENIKKSLYRITQNLDEHESNVNFSIHFLTKNNNITNEIETLSSPEVIPDNSIQIDIYRDGDVYMQFTSIYDIIYLSTGEPMVELKDPKFTWGPSYKNVIFKGSTSQRGSQGILYIKCVGTLEYEKKVVQIDEVRSANLLVG